MCYLCYFNFERSSCLKHSVIANLKKCLSLLSFCLYHQMKAYAVIVLLVLISMSMALNLRKSYRQEYDEAEGNRNKVE